MNTKELTIKSEQEFLKCMEGLCTIARSYNTTGVPPRFEPPTEGQYNYRVSERYVYMYQGMLDASKAFALLELVAKSLIDYPTAKNKVEWVAKFAWDFYNEVNSPADPNKLIPFQVWYAMRANWQMFIVNYIGLGYQSKHIDFKPFRLSENEINALTPEQRDWVLSVQDKEDHELFNSINEK